MKMAGGVEGAGFWLPLEFLSDDDFFMDKQHLNSVVPDSELCFPTELPCDFETQNAKAWLMSNSPQPTLAHLGSAGSSSNGSPNGPPSPPTTPLGAKYDPVGDLIYLATGQVDKLKLGSGYVMGSGLAPPRSSAQFYKETKPPIPSVYLNTHQKQLQDRCGMLYSRQQMHQNRGGMGQAAWTPHQNPSRGRAVLLGGSGGRGGGAKAKRPCAGTGVFLPRRYENISNSNAYSSDSQRKPGALFSGSAAVQLHTKHFDNVNGFVQMQPRPQPQPLLNRGFVPDYNTLLAGRRGMLLQQQQRLLASLAQGPPVIGRDLYLPQKWTY